MQSASPAVPLPAPRPATAALCVLVTFLVGLLAQAPTLGGGYALDDVPVVQRNPALERGWRSIPAAFRAPSWPGELEREPFRPLTSATFALERRATGGRVVPMLGHALNLLLHALAAALTARLLLRLWPERPLLGWAAGLLVAVHPLATCSLALLTGRAALLGVVLGLLGLSTFVAWRPGRHGALAWAAALPFLALLACEALVGLALVPFLLDAARGQGGPVRALRTRWPVYLAWWGGLALWGLVWAAHGPGASSVIVAEPGVGGRLALGLEALAGGLQRLIVPAGFLADRTHESVAGEGWPLVGSRLALVFATAVALLAAWLVPLRQGGLAALRGLLLAAGLMLLGAALTLPLGGVREDRWVYVALPALAVLAGLAADAVARWLGARPGARALGRVLPGLALLALTLLSAGVAHALKDDARAHDQLLAVPSGHGPARLRRAERLLRSAEEDLARSARLPVRHANPEQDPERGPLLASARAALAQADELLLAAVRHAATREDPRAWLLLGTLQLEQSKANEALESLSNARRLDPVLAPRAQGAPVPDAAALKRAARIQAGLMRAQAALGRPQAAADAAQEVVRREREAGRLPGGTIDLALLARAARVLIADGRYALGVSVLEQVRREATEEGLRVQAAAQLEQAQVAARDRVVSLLRQGRELQEQVETMRLALDAYEEALRIDPDSFEARYWSAQLRGMHFGSYERALESVEEGLERLKRGEAGPDRERRIQQLLELARRLRERRDAEEAEQG